MYKKLCICIVTFLILINLAFAIDNYTKLVNTQLYSINSSVNQQMEEHPTNLINNSLTSKNNNQFLSLIKTTSNKAKLSQINLIIQVISSILAIILSLYFAIFQLLNPKFHPILDRMILKRISFKASIIIILISIFSSIVYNFIFSPNISSLIIEFIALMISLFLLLYWIFKIIIFSNKFLIVKSYVYNSSEMSILKEVCEDLGYAKTMERPTILLHNTNIDYEGINSKINEINEKLSQQEKSEIDVIFDIMSLSIGNSEKSFVSEILDKLVEKFQKIITQDYNYQIIKNTTLFIKSRLDSLITQSIEKTDLEVYKLVVKKYEVLIKTLIDKNHFELVKRCIDQIGRHSFSLNKKVFHIDYSFLSIDLIVAMIEYYMEKEDYDDYKVQRWIEVLGAIGEDITNVKYKLKKRSIRGDYTSETEISDNPAYQILTKLEEINDLAIDKLSVVNENYNMGEAVLEAISFVLKNITLELMKINDSSLTYSVFLIYSHMIKKAIENELYYSLNFITMDLHKIGNELINKKWKNNANALLFDIAEMGILMENKNLTWSARNEPYHYRVAKDLKHLFNRFVEIFSEQPYQGNFFYELRIKHHNSDTFKRYYDSCEPNDTILEDYHEDP